MFRFVAIYLLHETAASYTTYTMPKSSNTASGKKAATKTTQMDELDKGNSGKRNAEGSLSMLFGKAPTPDDGVQVLVDVLTVQTSARHQSDNSWKSLLWVVASLALEGSELKSGSAPKNDEAC
jgi:hypothetical protein